MTRFLLFITIFLSFIYNPIKSQNTAGDGVFAQTSVHDVYLNFAQTSYWDTLLANYTLDVYTRGSVTIDGFTYSDIGAKFKGNSSYNNPSNKKSLKVGMDEFVSGQKHDGLKKFNLNNSFKDPTFMREKLMLDFCLKLGIPAPRCTYARVYLNNVYWGLYTFVEEINKTFLEDWFTDKRGNLFKGDPSGDLKWYGALASSYYAKYELKTNETTNDWSDLVRLIDKLNNTTATSFHDSLEDVMNTPNTIKAWAASNLFSNLDSYLGSGHNYYIYDDSLSFKFNWIVWDVNEAFGNFNMGMTVPQIEALSMFYISNPPTNRPLYNKMLANTTYKNQYIQEVCNMVSTYFDNSWMDPKIDSIANIIRPDVYSDPIKFFTNQNFEDNISMMITVIGTPGGSNLPGLKSFIQNKHAALVTELATQGCAVGINELIANNSVQIYPNPANDLIYITSTEQIDLIQVVDLAGQIVLSHKVTGNTSVSFSIGELAAGSYLLKVNNRTNTKFVKID